MVMASDTDPESATAYQESGVSEAPTSSYRDRDGSTLQDLEEEAEELLGDEEEDQDEEGDEYYEDGEEEYDDEEDEEEGAKDYLEEEQQDLLDDNDFKDDYFQEYQERFGPDETFRTLDSTNVQDLINMLAKVKLVWPEDLPSYNEELYNADPARVHYPESFYHCSPKEKAVMWHAENFRRQFSHIYPDRRPLLTCPKNECGCQKLFPTFINPTVIGYPEFYDAESTGKFMKDFLQPEFFRPPTRVPRFIRSHVTVLKKRKANSFEYSIVIVSLLNGAGFDTYVVDGYATKEITTMCDTEDFMDLDDAPRKFSETEFEFTEQQLAQDDLAIANKKKEDEQLEDGYAVFGDLEAEAIRPVSPSKYRVKAPKIYSSHYEQTMQRRAEEKLEEERLKAEKEAYDEMIKNQRPPTPDPLFGFRTHAWVLILPGRRGVTEPFFIEPFSGLRKEISDQNFLGIEAVFNERNYYANIQDCSGGIQDLSYRLNDTSKWAKLLLEPPCRRNCKKMEDDYDEDDEEEEGEGVGGGGGGGGPARPSLFGNEEEEEEVPPCEKYLDMPISWTPDIDIPLEDYDKRFPEGSKIKDYNDAFVETAAAFVNKDGMIKKVIKFEGRSRDPRKLEFIEETFAHRQDKLERRKWFRKGRMLHEYFEKGRKDSLKEHVHESGKNKAHYPRHLYYYSDVHPQGLFHRQVVPNGLIEEFEGRDDLLYYRAIYYGGFLCHTIPQIEDVKSNKVKAMLDFMRGEDHGNKSKPRKKILRIDEKYYRNPAIADANQDISEKYLFVADGKILLFFHYGDENFTRKTLEFFKPRGVNVNSIDFRPEDCIEFQVDPFAVPTSNYEKFMILQQLAKDELRASSQARQAEDEIYHTVTQRVQEDWTHKMEPNPYEPEDKGQKDRDAGKSESEDDLSIIDFATPYLEKYGRPANKRQEIALKQKIIKDARHKILKKARRIQKDYDEESAKLQAKMDWYDKMKDQMKSVDEEDFNLYYNDILFKLHIMEQRLIRHRERAPIYFNNLLLEVLRHPLLNVFANRKLSKEQKQKILQDKADEEEQRKLEAAQAKLPKDICCEYRYKHTEIKKDSKASKIETIAVPPP